MSNQLEALAAVLRGGVVSFHAIFAKMLGSVTAGLFLSQGYFWQHKAKYSNLIEVEGKTYFDRTSEEWFEDTGLSVEQQSAARERLRSVGILHEKKIGLPARLHYHICLETLVSVIYRYNETGKSVVADHRTKPRYITRAADGKFPKQATVKNGCNIIESSESSESEGECPPSLLKVELHDPEIPNVRIVHGFGATSAADEKTPPIRIGHRPNVETPIELEKALREFYKQYPTEWKDGVLENGKGRKYDRARRVEIVKDFCCYAISKNRGNDTYKMLNADLQAWFRNEQFVHWKKEQAKKPGAQGFEAVYEPPVIPVRS